MDTSNNQIKRERLNVNQQLFVDDDVALRGNEKLLKSVDLFVRFLFIHSCQIQCHVSVLPSDHLN